MDIRINPVGFSVNPVLEEFKPTYDENEPTNDTWKCFEAWFSNNSDVRKNMMVGVSLED